MSVTLSKDSYCTVIGGKYHGSKKNGIPNSRKIHGWQRGNSLSPTVNRDW